MLYFCHIVITMTHYAFNHKVPWYEKRIVYPPLFSVEVWIMLFEEHPIGGDDAAGCHKQLLCPSKLRDHWRSTLSDRFGREDRHSRAAEWRPKVFRWCSRARKGESNGWSGISSYDIWRKCVPVLLWFEEHHYSFFCYSFRELVLFWLFKFEKCHHSFFCHNFRWWLLWVLLWFD